MQIELSIINQENEVVMCSSGVDEAVLATKKYAFQAGDKFKVVTAEKQLVYVQLDNALGSSLVYLSKGEWVYEIPTTEKLREAYPPAAFLDEKHYFLSERLLLKNRLVIVTGRSILMIKKMWPMFIPTLMQMLKHETMRLFC